MWITPMEHFAYAIIVLGHAGTMRCFIDYHPDLVWC